jgi:hypothetical protein
MVDSTPKKTKTLTEFSSPSDLILFVEKVVPDSSLAFQSTNQTVPWPLKYQKLRRVFQLLEKVEGGGGRK